MSSALQAMDKARLLAVLKQSKKRMEKGNEDFVKAIDERIQHETKFRSAIRSLEQATTSTLDVLTLHEELEPSEKDAQSIINLKKEVKLVADMQLKLSKEVNLSRKRKQKLEEISREFKRILGNETRETVIEIMDSPPRENVNDTSSHPKSAPKTSIVAPTQRNKAQTPPMATGFQMLKQRASNMLAMKNNTESPVTKDVRNRLPTTQ
ncbi:uncharacterized protein LOC116342926 isoform X2 [Contarinia nasturtii]|uniref:uncharacterized protein LOC116342926 isoform X2 n=1 Tax=Contarinia nasturtii TaxID=265458 RepID=UPI0012D4B694|nr:uncharacterized protein LOC116342926 isoform X2 [Contarinia nasturtii]